MAVWAGALDLVHVDGMESIPDEEVGRLASSIAQIGEDRPAGGSKASDRAVLSRESEEGPRDPELSVVAAGHPSGMRQDLRRGRRPDQRHLRAMRNLDQGAVIGTVEKRVHHRDRFRQ